MLRKRYLQTYPCGPDFMLHNAILHVYTSIYYLEVIRTSTKLTGSVEKMWVNLTCYCFLLLECTDSKNPYTYIKSNTKLRKCC